MLQFTADYNFISLFARKFYEF